MLEENHCGKYISTLQNHVPVFQAVKLHYLLYSTEVIQILYYNGIIGHLQIPWHMRLHLAHFPRFLSPALTNTYTETHPMLNTRWYTLGEVPDIAMVPFK